MTEDDETTETTTYEATLQTHEARDTRVIVLSLWVATLIGWTLLLIFLTPSRLDDGDAPPTTVAPVETTTTQPLALRCGWEGEPNESAWLCHQETTTTEAKG